MLLILYENPFIWFFLLFTFLFSQHIVSCTKKYIVCLCHFIFYDVYSRIFKVKVQYTQYILACFYRKNTHFFEISKESCMIFERTIVLCFFWLSFPTIPRFMIITYKKRKGLQLIHITCCKEGTIHTYMFHSFIFICSILQLLLISSDKV